MQLLFSIVIWVIFGFATSYVAQQKGRDKIVWFFVGLLLGIIGLILVFILPAVESGAESTRSEEPSEPVAQRTSSEPAHEEEPELLPAEYLEGQWFYLTEDREQVGPLTFEEMEAKWREGVLQEETFVWCEKMPDWKKVGELKIFQMKNPEEG